MRKPKKLIRKRDKKKLTKEERNNRYDWECKK